MFSFGKLFFFLVIVELTSITFAKPIRLSNPEVLLAGWNARCLEHADLNKDGLEDIIYFNLDKSYLEILYRCVPNQIPKRVLPVKKNRWEPVLENAPYIQERIFISGTITDITTGDLNGDGELDLVTGSPDSGVKVYLREENNTWGEALEIETEKLRPFSQSLKVINLKGVTELYIFSEPGLEKISFIGGDPQYPGIIYREDSKKSYGVNLVDINGDGILDWMYLTQGEEYSLKVRLGKGKSFGPEISLDISLSSLPSVMGIESDDLQKKFCSIDALSNEAVVFSFQQQLEKENADPFEVITFDVFSKSNDESSWTLGDFNGDGFEDLVSVSSNKGEIIFLEADENEFVGSIQLSPSLRGITSVETHMHQGSANLLVLSPEEEVLGLSEYEIGKGFLFPRLLKIDGVPIVACSGKSQNKDSSEIFVISEQDSKYFLQTLQFSSSGKYELANAYQLKDLKREPSGLFPCELNGDDFQDLLILSNRESPVILLGDKKKNWVVSASDSIVRKSFLKGISKSRLSKFTKPSIRKENILVAGDGFVREICWEDNDFTVKEQYNAKDQSGKLSCPVRVNWKDQGTAEIFAFHEDGYWERLESRALKRNQKNRWESSFLEPDRVMLLKTDDGDQLLSLGKSGFQIITQTPESSFGIKFDSKYLTDLPKIRFSGIDSGDFNNDGIQDLVCLDGKKGVLEFLTFSQKEKKWQSSLHFEVFEKNLHYQGKKGGLFEPRDGLIFDVNGDDLDDLVFLVHDRLLIYKQIGSKK